MSESNAHGWIITVAAVEKSARGVKERLVRIPSRRTERAEAEREAEYRFRNDVESWAVIERIEIAGAVPVVPGPRLPQD